MDIESIKLNYIDDWKNEDKINIIMNLIKSREINRKTLLYIIGNKSKKTYSNGEIINDKSLTLKKFFDYTYREKSSEIRIKVDNFKQKLLDGFDFDKEIIDNCLYEIFKFIQATKICCMYSENELSEYKIKIMDIIDTRNKEEQFFDLFNKITFENLVNEPNHEALKYLLENGWKETKETYLWLTELITFINNGSQECKEYLISLFNLRPIENSDINSKKLLIKLVAKKKNLNINRMYEIIDFIFSIGNYYKHGTYYKWYNKELEYIQLFEKYSNENKNIVTIVDDLELSSEYYDELINLIVEYKTIIDEHFN